MMTITYTTPNPHGRARDLLIDAMLDALEREAEAEEAKAEDQPEG